MYIAVSGNIGSGKTAVGERGSERLGWKAYYEEVDDNPYLNDFYQDMGRWAFNLQMCFLSKKIRQIKEILNDKCDIIQDRTIFEEAYVFVTNLHKMGLLDTSDFDLYMEFFTLLTGEVKEPDIIIYLKASVPSLVSQIHKRGRAYEMRIEESYLASLNELYNYWIEKVYKGKVITIDIDETDFILYDSMFEKIVGIVQSEIAKIGLQK